MAQTAAVKQSKANARAQKQLGHNTWRKAFMQHYWLYIMMLPALLYMIIFNYLPMTGLYMAFTDFSPFNGDTILECVFGSPFAGLKYFKSSSPARTSGRCSATRCPSRWPTFSSPSGTDYSGADFK